MNRPIDKNRVVRTSGQILEFICSICMNVFGDPMVTDCGHTFCKQCIHQSLTLNDEKCPFCRNSVAPTAIKPASVNFKSLLDQLVVTCDYCDKGCHVEVQLDQLDKHIKDCHPNEEGDDHPLPKLEVTEVYKNLIGLEKQSIQYGHGLSFRVYKIFCGQRYKMPLRKVTDDCFEVMFDKDDIDFAIGIDSGPQIHNLIKVKLGGINKDLQERVNGEIIKSIEFITLKGGILKGQQEGQNFHFKKGQTFFRQMKKSVTIEMSRVELKELMKHQDNMRKERIKLSLSGRNRVKNITFAKINVKNLLLGGEMQLKKVLMSDTVEMLKMMIEQQYNRGPINIERIHLSYNGTLLENCRTLKDYGLTDDSCLAMFPRIKGGGGYRELIKDQLLDWNKTFISSQKLETQNFTISFRLNK